MRASLLPMAFALAFASGACVVVFGMDPLSERSGSDAGADGEADGASEDAGVCGVDDIGEVRKPASTPSGADGGSVYFALSSLDIGINANSAPPGFDLDRRITKDVATSGCRFADAGRPDEVPGPGADSPDGVDNATFSLAQTLRGLVAAFDPAVVNARLVEGYYGIVLRLDEWNGTDDDDAVKVLVFPTIGYWQVADGGAPFWSGGDPTRRFNPDAGDLLMPDGRFRIGTIGSSLRSADAWVKGRRLVARFDQLTVPLRSSVDELRSFDFTLQDAWVVATLSPAGTALEGGGVGGRVPSGQFLAQVKLIYDSTTRTYVCASAEANSGFFCSVRDIRASHCDDGKSLPCNAVSFGARFEASVVDKLGPFRERQDDEYRDAGQVPPGERCADAGDDPSYDCPP